MILFFAALFFNQAQAASLKFEDALKQILEKNTIIGVQKAKLDAAEVTSLSKKTAFLPSLSLSGTSQNSSSQTITSLAGQTTAWGVTASLNLFKSGADIAAMNAASSELDSQNYELKKAQLAAEDEAVAALTGQIEKEKEARIRDRQTETFRNFLAIAKQRYAKGVLPMQEVDKITIDTENAEARHKDMEVQVSSAKSNVERLLNSSDILIEWPWTSFLNPQGVKKLLSKEFKITERPDYQAAYFSTEAQKYNVSQSFRQIFPSLDFSYSMGYVQAPNTSAVAANTALFTLTMPIFDGLKDYSNYKISEATLLSSEIRLRQMQRDNQSEWRNAKDSFELALNTIQAREKTLKISQKLYDAGFSRFKQGRANANDLQLDQARLIEAEVLVVQGWGNLHRAYTKLCHSFGLSIFNCR